jgi:hypothetical protein
MESMAAASKQEQVSVSSVLYHSPLFACSGDPPMPTPQQRAYAMANDISVLRHLPKTKFR